MPESDIENLTNEFESAVDALVLSLKADSTEVSRHLLSVIDAFRQNMQIMLRLQSDVENMAQHPVTTDEVTEIGDFALNLLDEIAQACAERGMQQQMLQLHRLSLPVVVWVKEYNGVIKKLDIVVNAIASYANTLQENEQLEALCVLIENVLSVTDKEIKQDLEMSNPMRPWRILNLNWGIVATRTHNAEMMSHVFDCLIENIPADAPSFFNEGMQQMDIVGYPDHVRTVMQKYAEAAAAQSRFH